MATAIASGSWDSTVRLWNVASGREIRQLQGHTSGVRCVAFSPDGKLLVSGSSETLQLWDVVSGREIRQLLHGFTCWNNSVTNVSFSPDGKLLALASEDGVVRFWKVENHPK